jgi:tetraacyldisaccharide 4'-kinase
MSYQSLISGEMRGLVPSLARAGLGLLSFAYGRVTKVRNAYYDTWAMPTWLDAPVISVGNLTVGGTGKTPMTIWLCERMLERGRKPAVLSRGYKAGREGLADELLLVSRRVPQAVAVANADRATAGRYAIEEHQARAVILDDGFQHRRLGRDLDLLLIDATRPFGYGHLLPRGLLREHVGSVRRAEAVIITRCDQAEEGRIAEIVKEVRSWSRDMPVVRAVHRPASWADLAGKPVARPAGARPGLLAGIARPDAFENTVQDLGFAPAARAIYDDHHAYEPRDAEWIAGWIRDERLDCVLTTEKDAVKLARLAVEWPAPMVSVVIRMEMLDDGERVLCDLIDRMLVDHDEYEKSEEKPSDAEVPESRPSEP